MSDTPVRKTSEAPAVALVPGFFGFDHSASRTYFADRFIAGIRAGLEARGARNVPVVAVSTLGIASLVDRQNDLLSELRALETPSTDGPRLGGPREWHLVGHSTGGVDAALLLREHPLARGPIGSTYAARGWDAWSDLVTRIRSVTTLAAPHFGTALAESAIGKFATGRPTFAAVRNVARGALDLARRGDLGSRVTFAFSAMPGVTHMPFFVGKMILRNDLARDLRPVVMGPLGAAPFRRDVRDQVFSVATVAPRPGREHEDKLFRDLWRWTHDAAAGLDGSPASSPPSLDDLALRLPSQRGISLPPIAEGDNDGVVSTRRQVIGRAIALVVGDHVDVLGRYRRTSLVDGKVIDPGLLTSGADFGDDEFFSLIDRIAGRVAKSIEEARGGF